MNQLFVIGAQRSGSTYLYRILDEHPEITMAQPVSPESKFFMDEEKVSKGPSYYEALYFSQCKKAGKYIGEKSTSYIEKIEAIKRIKTFYPAARILVILRNPVIRAYSNYCFSVDNGIEDKTFAEAIGLEELRLREGDYRSSVNPYAYVQRGHYIDYLERYAELFSGGQLKTLIFEELIGNQQNIQELYGWLGVDCSFIPTSMDRVVNSSAGESIDKVNPPEIIRELCSTYAPSLARLESFLGREINVWRNQWRELQ